MLDVTGRHADEVIIRYLRFKMQVACKPKIDRDKLNLWLLVLPLFC
jgi:hypothetical protein